MLPTSKSKCSHIVRSTVMLSFLKPFDAHKIHRLNVSYLALVNNSCASQREGFVFFSSCYFFFSDISVMSVLEHCSHSGEITLHCWSSGTHLHQKVDFPLCSFCASSVRRLLHQVCGPSPQRPMENVGDCAIIIWRGGVGKWAKYDSKLSRTPFSLGKN